MFCILFTMCTCPSQSVKISIHSCTFLKNFPIWRLMPFQYIPFFLGSPVKPCVYPKIIDSL